MKFSLQATMVIGAILAIACLGVSITGFASLGDLPDPAVAADAKGYAWFWAFLALVALAFAVASWWLVRTNAHGEDA